MNETTAELARGLLEGHRWGLARGITLVESSKEEHKEQAAHLIDHVLAHADREKFFAGQDGTGRMFDHPHTIRIGIAGPPGAGKSTFIEALGTMLVERQHRVAVVPVDPSSHISGGSILGDKTRMELLSRSKSAYVRASPTSGVRILLY
jgi:LAO/AO transport system kinase